MKLDIENLFAAVSPVCPLVSIHMGNPTDRTTWKVVLASTATPAQIAAAKTAIQQFTPTVSPVVTPGATAGVTLNGNGV